MADDGSMVIEVAADEPELELEVAPKVEPEKPVVEAEPEKTVETPKIEGVEELRAQLEAARQQQAAERSARAAAEAERDTERARVSRAHTEVIDSHLASIESASQAENAKLAAAKQRYKAALEAGDWASVTDANEEIAGCKSVLLRLDEGKADLEARKASAPTRETAPAQRQAAQPVQQQTKADPFEAAIARLSPRTQAWLRKHPECVNDQKMNLKANAADSMARAEGFIPDSDAYFDYCERYLGYKTDEQTQTQQTQTRTVTQPRTRTAMAAAPVRNASNGSSNGNLGEGQVVLSRGEQEVATDGTITWGKHDLAAGRIKDPNLVGQPIGLREMARRKLVMSKEGQYDRVSTGT